MKSLYKKLQIISLCFAPLATPIVADDTDIYLTSSSPTSDEPMVMFALDWRPNLASTVCNAGSSVDATIATNCSYDIDFVTNYLTASEKSDGTITYFELLRGSLRQAMAPLDGVKIGFMINHDDNCNGSPTSGPAKTGCSNGGYIMQGFRSIDATDSNGNKAAFHNLLSSIPDPQGTASHKWQGKELYFEFFRYLTGQGIYNGHLGWNDFSNTTNSDNLDGTGGPESPDYSAIAWDSSIEKTSNYITPFVSSMVCSKVFVINIMFQVSQQEDNSDSAITDSKANGGMNSIVLSGSSNSFNTVINWLYKNDLADGTISMQTASNAQNIDIPGKQNVISYFLVDSPNNTTNGYASAGGTGSAIALGSDPEAMTSAISNIFNQILSVSTSFVSASVPVNVFNRADFLNDVFLAIFEAEENGFPKWIGNLKKLQLHADGFGGYYIGDTSGAVAFAADGRINFNALTYWTDSSGFDVQAADTTKGEQAGYDGRSVNRGGAGQQIPGFLGGSVGLSNTDIGARQIYTEPASYSNGTATTLMSLDASTTNAGSLWNDLNANGIPSSSSTLNNTSWSAATSYSTASVADKDTALDMLKFARGIDVKDEDLDGSTTDTRPWLMGDPIHSRPLTINYGITQANYTQNQPDVRVIVTGNDGFVHMFQNLNNTPAESGVENWAFTPRYALRILNRLMTNTAGAPLHPYGVDSSPVAYIDDSNDDGSLKAADGDKVYLYFGMRRGGRAYYALDISNPNVPKILWSISDADTNFAELGLTFSRPRVAKLSYDGYTLKPVLIFAGGYDTNKDTRSTSMGTDDTRGNAIYIVDAETGALIWKAIKGTGSPSSTVYQHDQLNDSIPSDVTAVDTDGNQSIDRIYVGDTGGTIWRADLAGTNRTAWKLQRFANVGRHHDGSNKRHDRRFFHAISVAQTRDTAPYDAVVIGSGDRPNPLDKSIGSDTPENWLYMFKDRKTTSGDTLITLYNHDSVADLSDNCLQEVGATCTADQISKLASAGWKIKMEQGDGEKILSRPLIVSGVIYFSSYLPPGSNESTLCGPDEGSGLNYAVSLHNATAVFNLDLSNATYGPSGEVIELQIGDRFYSAGAGIPSDPIVITKDGNNYVQSSGDPYLRNASSLFANRTYWYIEGE